MMHLDNLNAVLRNSVLEMKETANLLILKIDKKYPDLNIITKGME
jgi:hypothetical protein